jgi:hypothetical protein
MKRLLSILTALLLTTQMAQAGRVPHYPSGTILTEAGRYVPNTYRPAASSILTQVGKRAVQVAGGAVATVVGGTTGTVLVAVVGLAGGAWLAYDVIWAE